MPYGGNAFAPIQQQINRTGDIMTFGAQLQRQDAQDAERRLMNEQQRMMNAFTINKEMLAQKLAEQHRNAFSKAYQIADPTKDPEGFGRAYVMSGGNPEMAMKIMEDAAKGFVKLGAEESLYDPRGKRVVAQGGGSGLTGEAKNLKAMLGREPTLEDYAGFKERIAMAGAPKLEVKNTMERENELVNSAIKKLPEIQKEANASRSAIIRIDRAKDILDRQGDSVTGLSGAIKSALAPYAKVIGVDIAGMNDAQILQSLLKEGAGGLRSQVIGPGQVSNYEQEIMQMVSGGKMAAADGVRAVLDYQRQNHAQLIDNYNEQVDSISKVKGYEQAKSIYKPVQYKKIEAPKAKQTSTQGKAPAAAEAYLKQHPETKEAFKAKYGYLPEGE